jgi:hypothetical protein
MNRYLGGWRRHMMGRLKTEKLHLSSIIDEIHAFAEV